jgi:type IV secretory pathway VirB10-like protein
MNTFWLKAAGVVVVIIIAAIVILSLTSGRRSTSPEQPRQREEKEKTFYDVAAEDEKRLRAEPETRVPEAAETPEANQPAQPTRPTAPKPEPVQPAFTQLNEAEKAQASQLFENAIKQRQIGRLPGTGFRQMVDMCRRIIEQFPGSEYDFKARRMLADLPERYKERYDITQEETDLSHFYKKSTN